MAKIVVIGSTNTDMVVKSARLPKPGETLLGGKFFTNLGGKGANQAVAVARMGGEVNFISRLGDDVFGKKALHQFKKEGISSRYLSIDEYEASGTALITIGGQGENVIVVAPGANNTLTSKHIDDAKEDIKSADIVLIQLEIPMQVVTYAIQMANALGKRVILNPAPAQQLTEKSLSCLYAITPNESEAEYLTSVKVVDEHSAKMASRVLRAQGVEVVIITMGDHGAHVSSDEFEGMLPGRKVEVVDTTAAGDTFNGALSVALGEGKSIKDAVIFANYAASLSVTKLGAQVSIPNRDEILLVEMPT